MRREPASAFAALRTDKVLSDGLSDTFLGIVEITKFALLRCSVGTALANKIVGLLAARICAVIPNSEIGRLNRTSIEFAFSASTRDEAERLIDAAVGQLERRVEIEGLRIEPVVCLGVAAVAFDETAERALDHAAAALFEGQRCHRKILWADNIDSTIHENDDLALMLELPRAMANDELALVFQPKLRARTNRVDSVEALLRWRHPRIGAIPIDRVIKMAETTGSIRDLSEWVIARAVASQRRLLDAGHDLTVYVNISGGLVADADFVKRALCIVNDARDRIGFEITETAVIDDPESALANLHDIAAAGIRIAIDDYGSGLSSLAYLKQLPAQEMKIDRLFVSGLINSHRDPLLVRSSIDLAHALEMEVTAEGVDDPMALALLRIMGCDMMQGYLIAPPLPISELIAFLEDSASLDRFGETSASGSLTLRSAQT